MLVGLLVMQTITDVLKTVRKPTAFFFFFLVFTSFTARRCGYRSSVSCDGNDELLKCQVQIREKPRELS